MTLRCGRQKHKREDKTLLQFSIQLRGAVQRNVALSLVYSVYTRTTVDSLLYFAKSYDITTRVIVGIATPVVQLSTTTRTITLRAFGVI
eukprot:scaffold19316_cov48-Prasinocladus_malaysianus.AAC.2